MTEKENALEALIRAFVRLQDYSIEEVDHMQSCQCDECRILLAMVTVAIKSKAGVVH